MNNESGKIKSFTDLDAWKEGHVLVLDIYKKINGLIKQLKTMIPNS